MSWRVGDLGRFYMDSPRVPRFEVIRGVKGQGVEVWYGGSSRTTIVPIRTFRSDCVPVWQWEAVSYPVWLRPGITMMLDKHAGPLYQVQMIHRRATGATWQSPHVPVEAQGQTFTVRSIRHDHLSCVALSSGILTLMPVKVVTQHGFRSLTAWDRINSDDWIDYNDDDFSDVPVE